MDTPPKRPHARISRRSPRYETWLEVFGSDTVPIETAAPHRGHLPGLGLRLCYRVHLPSLAPEQRERLIAYLAEVSGDPPDLVERIIDDAGHGCPILADDVIVIVDSRLLI